MQFQPDNSTLSHMANDLNAALRNAIAAPASVTIDGQTTTEQPIASLLAATRFQMATRARSTSPLAGASITKLIPHGAVLPDRCPGSNRGPVGL